MVIVQRHLRALLAVLSLIVLVGPALASDAALEASVSAQAVAIKIVAPGQDGILVGSVSAPPDAVSSGAGAAYPADGSVLTSGAVTANASGGVAAGDATATASSEVVAVSMFGGEVTVGSVVARVRASTSGAAANGDFDGAGVTDLVVAGQAIAVGPGSRIPLGDWGYADVLQQSGGSGAPAGPPSYRAGVTALAVHLLADHGGLPVGSEILIGVAEVSAQGTAPPPPPPPVTPPPVAPPPVAPPPVTPPPAPRPRPPVVKPRPPVVQPPPPVVQPPPTSPAPRPKPKQPQPKPEPAPPEHISPEGDPVTSKPQPKPPEPAPGVPSQVRAPPANVRPKLTAGRYVFPVYGPSSYTDTYGAARADVSYHHGDDIFAPLGAPLLAVADGTVFSVGWNHIGGYRLWLRDRQGNQFYYAHLSAYSPLAVNGLEVRAGDVLGYVGNTGDAVGTPYHVHFEIHPVSLLHLGYDGAVNPTVYLDAWRRIEDVRLGPLPGWVPRQAAVALAAAGETRAPQAPRAAPPSAILLQVTDISTADGLDPGSLQRALAPASAEGDGALIGLVQSAPRGPHPVVTRDD